MIRSPFPSEPDKSEIAVEGADDLYKEIRTENTFVNEQGNHVGLKQGAQVEVTIEAEQKHRLKSMTDIEFLLIDSCNTQGSYRVKCDPTYASVVQGLKVDFTVPSGWLIP
jgi:hypothetical protein